MHIHVPVYVLSVCDCIILRFILPPSSRATTSPGFEGKTFWDNRSHAGMDRTRFYHRGSQLHSKLNKGIRAFILRDWRGCNFGQDKAKLAKNSSRKNFADTIIVLLSLVHLAPVNRPWMSLDEDEVIMWTFWVSKIFLNSTSSKHWYLALTIPMDFG